jgi:hypothetical protein
MSGVIVRLVLVSGTFLLGSGALAGDPPKAEPIAPPKGLIARPLIDPGPVLMYAPISRYSVWQNYGVDRAGKFRPLVIWSPYGAYYRYNGAPYPWATTRTMEFMPYVVD